MVASTRGPYWNQRRRTGGNAITVGSSGANFTTPTAAQAAAATAYAATSVRQCIEVFPGTYTDHGLGANGVDWFLWPGAKFSYTSNADGCIFGDGGVGIGGGGTAMTYNIWGFGEFTRTATTAETQLANVFLFEAASKVRIWGLKATVACNQEGNASIGGWVLRENHASANIGMTIDDYDITQGGLCWWSGGFMDAHGRKAVMSGYSALWYADADSNDMHFHLDNVTGTGQCAFGQSLNGTSAAAIWASGDKWSINNTLGITSGTYMLGAHKVYYDVQKMEYISTAGTDSFINVANGQLWFRAQKAVIDSPVGFLLGDGISHEITIAHVEATTNNCTGGYFNTTGGTHDLYIGKCPTGVNSHAYIHTAGTSRVHSGRFTTAAGTGAITAITQNGTSYTLTCANHGLQTSTTLAISGVVSTGNMATHLNTTGLVIASVTTNTFTINHATATGVYTSGGTWVSEISPFSVGGAGLSIGPGVQAISAGAQKSITAAGAVNVTNYGYESNNTKHANVTLKVHTADPQSADTV